MAHRLFASCGVPLRSCSCDATGDCWCPGRLRRGARAPGRGPEPGPDRPLGWSRPRGRAPARLGATVELVSDRIPDSIRHEAGVECGCRRGRRHRRDAGVGRPRRGVVGGAQGREEGLLPVVDGLELPRGGRRGRPGRDRALGGLRARQGRRGRREVRIGMVAGVERTDGPGVAVGSRRASAPRPRDSRLRRSHTRPVAARRKRISVSRRLRWCCEDCGTPARPVFKVRA